MKHEARLECPRPLFGSDVGTFETAGAGPGGPQCGPRTLRPHDLRRGAVALWTAPCADPKEVAARAGHTSVSFTLDV